MKQVADAVKQFQIEKERDIQAMTRDKSTKRIGRLFMDHVLDYKYGYYYTWMGRPIIQQPQDIVALQEVIMEVQPDLIIETGIAHALPHGLCAIAASNPARPESWSNPAAGSYPRGDPYCPHAPSGRHLPSCGSSNSKSCSELVTDSYRGSFLDARGVSVSTARAGNVIGGGDFAPDGRASRKAVRRLSNSRISPYTERTCLSNPASPLETLAREGKLGIYRHTGFWQCMDTQRDRSKLEELWQNEEAPWKLWK